MKNLKSLILFLFIISVFSCSSENEEKLHNEEIEISFTVNKDVYLLTDYGEPPQIAVWLEYTDSLFYKSIWVTRRTGKNKWKGKVNCPVSLPYWNSRKGNEKEPGFIQKVVDAVSGATVAEGEIKKKFSIVKNDNLSIFIEVNVSGDYNNHFKYWSENNVPDTEGNGQPSIIYSAKLDFKNSVVLEPVLTGRTEQFFATDSLNADLSEITTAKDLIKNLKVRQIKKDLINKPSI